MTAKVKIGATYVNERIAIFVDKWFDKRTPGIEFVLETFYYTFNHGLGEIKGVFTEVELNLIANAFNGTLLTPQIVGQHLRPQVEDGCSFEQLDKKWEVEKDKLLEKIDKLTNFQKTIVEIWAVTFWKVVAAGKGDEENFKNILI